MSWSKPVFKSAFIVLVGIFILTGCTLRPVYDNQNSSGFQVAYADPTSRVEQLILEELRLRVGKSATPVYHVDINASTSTRGVFSLGSNFQRNETEARVTAEFVLTKVATGEKVANASRFATATYQENPQKIAANTAQQDAYGRAAKIVAQQLQLMIVKAINEDQN